MEVKVITNLPDFHAQMRRLGADLERKTFRGATAAAAGVLKKAVADRAPVMPSSGRGHNAKRVVGALKRGVYAARTFRGSRPGVLRYFIGVRSGRRSRSGVDPFYWRWVDQGHAIARSRIRGGARTKALMRSRARAAGRWVEGRYFMQEGFQAGYQRAIDVFYARVARDLARNNQP